MRVARDLHDSVLQDLTAAVLQLNTAGAHRVPSRRAKRCCRSAARCRAIRRASATSSAARAADRTASAALPTSCRCSSSRSARNGIAASRSASSRPRSRSATASPPELCLALSEATANAARHGTAKEVTIAIERRGKLLDVTIRDDGTGSNMEGIPRAGIAQQADRQPWAATMACLGCRTLGFCVRMEVPLERVGVMTSLVLCDDHPLILRGLVDLIAARTPDMDIVATCGDGQQAIDAIVEAQARRRGARHFDAAARTGSKCSSRLPREQWPVRVVFLTGCITDEQVVQAIAAGAHGIVLKESAAASLVDCLRHVAERREMAAVRASCSQPISRASAAARRASPVRDC